MLDQRRESTRPCHTARLLDESRTRHIVLRILDMEYGFPSLDEGLQRSTLFINHTLLIDLPFHISNHTAHDITTVLQSTSQS